ncbi:S8 family serine peptidase [Mycoplasmopsis verecunda]|uniref:Subtilase family protein n=1 Tax=Mycoplasmopsis verecunda TaxID=171291 RepID=A0A1T4M549_9BACT|nr:S8 family serine peptidase [Mycoplasmopsis verecunda]WPB54364.1 S8 family serine peptidase [Mycoplasmopsis verecunda]SJZ62129.1 Subtilase family protein [Mycoplasmopsis verecunda]
MKWKFFTPIMGSLIILPSFALVSANTNDEKQDLQFINNIVDIKLTNEQINVFRNLFQHYYQKLGVSEWNRNFSADEIDYNSPYNKVGILEVNNEKMDYLLSNKKNFKINYYNYPITSNKLHGAGVTSIIGTDTGINPDANIYYASFYLNNKESPKNNLRGIFEWFRKNGVNIVNSSTGPSFEVKPNIEILQERNKWMKHQSKISKYEITKDNDDKELADEWDYVVDYDTRTDAAAKFNNPEHYQELIEHLESLAYLMEFYKFIQSNKPKEKTEFERLIDEYTTKYNMIFIRSSSNRNTDKEKLFFLLENFTNNYKNIKDHIISYQRFINDKTWMGYLNYYNINNSNKYNTEQIQQNKTNLNHIINLVNYLFNHNKMLYSLKLRYSDKYSNKFAPWNFSDDFDKYHFGSGTSNAIYVGALNYNNQPTRFSSFLNKKDYYPLISAYGLFGEYYNPKNVYGIEPYIKYVDDDKKQKVVLDDDLIGYKNKYLEKRSIKSEFIKKYSKNDKNSNLTEVEEEFNNYVEYLSYFSGTSMSSPMIAGLLSLFQTKYKVILTPEEARLLLVNSSNYASTSIEKVYIRELDYEINKEFWKANHSKNKTGYGIPKFFKMKEIYDASIKSLVSNGQKVSDLLGSGFNEYVIKQEFNDLGIKDLDRLKYTASFNNVSYDELINNYFMKWANNNFDRKILNAVYKHLKWHEENKGYYQSSNVVDLEAIVKFIDNEGHIFKRYKWSNSSNANVEQIYFGKYRNKDYPELTINIIFRQFLDIISSITESYRSRHFKEENYVFMFDGIELKDVKNLLRKLYKRFVDEHLNYKYILEVNK